MPTFDVTQMLCKERVVRVEARDKTEATRLAEEGHGEVVKGRNARLKLLTVMGVVTVPDA